MHTLFHHMYIINDVFDKNFRFTRNSSSCALIASSLVTFLRGYSNIISQPDHLGIVSE